MLFGSETKLFGLYICFLFDFWRLLMVRQSSCFFYIYLVVILLGKVFFVWYLNYSLELQKVFFFFMFWCQQSDFLGLGMFYIVFILGFFVLRQLVSVNDQVAVFRFVRLFFLFQNKGNILGCGFYNIKEILNFWDDFQWETSYFLIWFGFKCRKT